MENVVNIHEIQPNLQNVTKNTVDVEIQEIQRSVPQGAVITVIGVGGGGSNMITHLAKISSHKDVKLVAANTDIQALHGTSADVKIKLGEKLTRGLGAGAQPEIGEKAALETYEEIKAVLNGSDIVFISTGLGGGTGTGASPVIAKAAKEIGALTVSVVTKPFKNEGNKRAKLAEMGLQNLKAESDCIIVIPNERVFSIIPKNFSMGQTFAMVDDILARAVNGMSSVLLNHASSDINVDFADVKTIMSHRGLALMGIGEANGDSSASEAMHTAIESPLLDNISIEGAKGALVYFEIHEDYPMSNINEALEIINSTVAKNADVVMGTHRLHDAPQDYARVIVIATGFEREIVANSPSGNGGNAQEEQNALQEDNIRQLNENFRTVNKAYKEEYNLFSDELDVPSYLRAGRD